MLTTLDSYTAAEDALLMISAIQRDTQRKTMTQTMTRRKQLTDGTRFSGPDGRTFEVVTARAEAERLGLDVDRVMATFRRNSHLTSHAWFRVGQGPADVSLWPGEVVEVDGELGIVALSGPILDLVFAQ